MPKRLVINVMVELDLLDDEVDDTSFLDDWSETTFPEGGDVLFETADNAYAYTVNTSRTSINKVIDL